MEIETGNLGGEIDGCWSRRPDLIPSRCGLGWGEVDRVVFWFWLMEEKRRQ